MLLRVSAHTVQAALIASLYGGALSWYNVSASPWPTKAAWYSGLMITIGALCSATSQSITLFRFSTSGRDLELIRRVLRGQKDHQGRWRPNPVAMYVWQVPVMMLIFGIVLFIVGLLFLLWDLARESRDDLIVSAGSIDLLLPIYTGTLTFTQVAVIFTCIVCLAILNYYFCSWAVYIHTVT